MWCVRVCVVLFALSQSCLNRVSIVLHSDPLIMVDAFYTVGTKAATLRGVVACETSTCASMGECGGSVGGDK